MVTSATTSASQPADLIELGKVVSAYGVRGWVKIQPYAAGSSALLGSHSWWLQAPQPLAGSGALSASRKWQVVQSRTQGSSIVAHLEGLNDRTLAEGLKGYTVFVPRSQFPATDPDEYYWVDLIGCQLFGEHNDQQVLIGTVTNVIDNGAHAVLQVERQTLNDQGGGQALSGPSGKPVHVLVPFVSAHVHTVDLPGKRLESNWPAEF